MSEAGARVARGYRNITQTGSTFSGTIQFPWYQGGTMMVSGTITGNAGTFTMTIAAGSMITGSCSATSTGTFDMDEEANARNLYGHEQLQWPVQQRADVPGAPIASAVERGHDFEDDGREDHHLQHRQQT